MASQNVKNKNFMIKSQKGSMLVVVMAASSLFLIVTVGAIGLALLQRKLNLQKVAYTQALHVAEAGVNYYRWVLYRGDEEYCNKEECLGPPHFGPYGPYAYTDSAGQDIIGYYELYITPPPTNGSSIVIIRSVGWVDNHPNIKRTIEVKCGIPSWSIYSTLSNANVRFGQDTEVWGPIHSNEGIRFDGLAHNLISSALLDYSDPDHTGPNEFGVHTHVGIGFGTYDPAEVSDGSHPPNPPIRNDVFLAGRDFPTTTVSFNLLNNYANNVYAKATSTGLVFDPRPVGAADIYSEPEYWGCGESGSFCAEGFHIKLNPNNTFEIRGVSSVQPPCWGDAPSLSIAAYEPIPRIYDIPANGIIFVKHNVWIEGRIDGSRATILAFSEPFSGNLSDIIINNDLLYTNYDGTDAIGLVAQRNIGPGLFSEGSLSGNDDGELRIDAALIAKGGNIGRPYYHTPCSQEFHVRNTITVYGSLASNERYGFSWSCGMSQQWCSGYKTRNLIYDNNLTFAPPPHFPTTGEYTFISWKEE